MATVANPSPQDKPKAYHAQFMGLSGILTGTAEGHILFLEHESSAVITINLETDADDLIILGSVAEAMEQMVLDLVEGRAAKACGREEGRQ